MKKTIKGFTLIELLIVIVVIGILSSISMFYFLGIQARTRDAQRTSQTTIIAEALEKYYDKNGQYPSCTQIKSANIPTILQGTSSELFTAPKDVKGSNSFLDNCSQPEGDSNEDKFAYVGSGSACKDIACEQWVIKYKEEATGNIISIASRRRMTCPTGFIIVPGSVTYNTADFCVMKYEAKNNGSNMAVSKADGLPWAIISQLNAKTKSAQSCNGCHLMTEAEWMTIAQDVAGVASNWSDGVVGTGSNPNNFIYNGHSDDAAGNKSLAASTDDDGYFGTGDNSSSKPKQKRTLKLSNNETIWDLSGNLEEWIDKTIPAKANPADFTFSPTPDRLDKSHEWQTVMSYGTDKLEINPFPKGTGIAGANNWSANTNGIGKLYLGGGTSDLYALIRGCDYECGISSAGIFSLHFDGYTNGAGTTIGFRVAR